jgi:hypothetical protein
MWPLGWTWSGSGFSWFYGFPIRTVMIHGHPLLGNRMWLEGGWFLNPACHFLAVSVVGNLLNKLRARWPRINSAWALAAFVTMVYGALWMLTFGLGQKTLSIWLEELKR